MTKVILGLPMSLDGSINDQDGSMETLFHDLVELHHSQLMQDDPLQKLAAPARRAMAAAGIQHLEQLAEFSLADVASWHGIGPNALSLIQSALEAKGLSFKTEKVKTMDSKQEISPSLLISNQIAGFADWRGEMLARLRQLIHETAPDLLEEWKWDTAVWTQKGNVVSTCAFKDHVRLNFFKGASLKDPHGVFNAGLEAKASRGINFFQGEKINEPALKELIHLAVAQNILTGKKKS